MKTILLVAVAILVQVNSWAGNIKISIDPTFTVTNIGTSQVGYPIPCGRFIIDASDMDENVVMTYLPLNLSSTNLPVSNIVEATLHNVSDNPYPYDGNGIIVGFGFDPSTNGLQHFSFAFPGLLIPKGTKKTIEIRAYVQPPTIGGLFSWGIVQPTNSYTGAFGLTSGNIASVTFIESPGQILSVVNQGHVGVENHIRFSGAPISTNATIGSFDVSVTDYESVSMGALVFRTSVGSTTTHINGVSNIRMLDESNNVLSVGVIRPDLAYPQGDTNSTGIVFYMTNIVWQFNTVHTIHITADLSNQFDVGDTIGTYLLELPTITGLTSGSLIYPENWTISSVELRSPRGKITSLQYLPASGGVGSTVVLNFSGLPNLFYNVEKSVDLIHWSRAAPSLLTSDTGDIQWFESLQPEDTKGFYRLVLVQ